MVKMSIIVLLLGIAAPVAAQLQSATMTVGFTPESLDDERYGYTAEGFNTQKGSLTPSSFDHDGVTYTIVYIEWIPSDDAISLGISRPASSDDFILWLDGTAYPLADAYVSGVFDGYHYFDWYSVGDIGWSEDQKVAVMLTTEPEAVPALPPIGVLALIGLLVSGGYRRFSRRRPRGRCPSTEAHADHRRDRFRLERRRRRDSGSVGVSPSPQSAAVSPASREAAVDVTRSARGRPASCSPESPAYRSRPPCGASRHARRGAAAPRNRSPRRR